MLYFIMHAVSGEDFYIIKNKGIFILSLVGHIMFVLRGKTPIFNTNEYNCNRGSETLLETK